MSVLLETPSGMRHIAAHIRSSADNVREHAHRLTTAAEATRWHSPAAAQFRDHIGELARQLLAAADRLDGAAHALERHAHHVDDVLSAPKRAGKALGGAIGRAVGW